MKPSLRGGVPSCQITETSSVGSRRGRCERSFRPPRAQARCAGDAARHGDEAGRDRTALRVALALRDGGRARRVRQDDAPRGVGRVRSASVRLGRARRGRRRRRGVPAVHRRRDPSRRTAPARGHGCAVGPRRLDLVEARPACRERTGCARAPAGAGARRSARRRQPVQSGRARSAGRVRPGRLADRDREPGSAGAAACPLAGAGRCARGRRGGPAVGRARGRVAAAGGRCRARTRRAVRADRADGGLARRPVPGCAVDAGGRTKLGERRGALRRRRIRVPVLPLRAPVPAAAGRVTISPVHLGAGSHVRRPLRRRAADDEVGPHARDARAHERLRGAARPARAVVSLPPPVRRAAAHRARAQRAACGVRSEPPRDGLVHRQRPDGGGGRLRSRRG